MEVSAGTIRLTSLRELVDFIDELGLAGEVRLQAPLIDQAGKILLQEGIRIRQSFLDKMMDINGQFRPIFDIKIDAYIMNAIRTNITKSILKSAKANEFVAHLLERSPRTPRPFVFHGLRSEKLILLSYKLKCEQNDFFQHLAHMGLLSLGLALNMNLRVPMLHRTTFLAGYCADLALADSRQWKTPIKDDKERKAIVEQCAGLLEKMFIAPGLSTIVRNHYFSRDKPQVLAPAGESLFDEFFEDEAPAANEPPAVGEESPPAEVFEEEQAREEARTAAEEDMDLEKLDEEVLQLAAEILKIARFSAITIAQDGKAEGELVARLAYNAARGYFDEKLTRGVLSVFREYTEHIRRMTRVAEVERKCPINSSAWAYPKPRPSQVLCVGNHSHCSFAQAGNDIHVLKSREAYGWLGKMLPAHTYQKCRLEYELDGGPSSPPKT